MFFQFRAGNHQFCINNLTFCPAKASKVSIGRFENSTPNVKIHEAHFRSHFWDFHGTPRPQHEAVVSAKAQIFKFCSEAISELRAPPSEPTWKAPGLKMLLCCSRVRETHFHWKYKCFYQSLYILDLKNNSYLILQDTHVCNPFGFQKEFISYTPR